MVRKSKQIESRSLPGGTAECFAARRGRRDRCKRLALSSDSRRSFLQALNSRISNQPTQKGARPVSCSNQSKKCSVTVRLTPRRRVAPGNQLDDTETPSSSDTRQPDRWRTNYCFSLFPRRDTRPTLATWVIFMTSRYFELAGCASTMHNPNKRIRGIPRG